MIKPANLQAYADVGKKAKKKRPKKKMKGPHPGFENVAQQIAAREGVSADRARAMLAASTRGASAKAKKANPRLRRVKG